jgi:ABC-type methionine transport system ATPase subunit
MSNLPSIESQLKVVQSSSLPFAIAIDINIPQQLHQEPVLAKLIGNYNLIVNIKAAVLDRKATGGGWFTLNLEGYPEDIKSAINYLRNLDIQILSHGLKPIHHDWNTDRNSQISIDSLVTNYDL